jgi:membrane protein YqaA with SNARE-associated domain
MFDRLYDRIIALSESPQAPYALAAIAFAESSVFPIPPDVILAPMSLAQPKLAWRFAGIATIASVLGGIVGYGIGALLFNADKMAALEQTYARWGALVILIKGLTPIPFKLVTIVSGLLGYNFPLFVLLSVITRGGRFFLLAGALNYFGDPLRVALKRYFGWFLVLMALSVVVGYFVATRVI